jgi:Secretion system C-terminal sorting domain
VLERSTDNQTFEVLNPFVQAAGTTNQPVNYEHLDFQAAFNQPYFYRLRMVDLDGAAAMSNIAEAMITNGTGSSAFFYPNPVNNSLNLHVFAATAQNVTMKLYDATGRLVYNNVYGVEAGSQNIDLAAMLQRLSYGTYNAVVNLDGTVHTTKLVVNQ